MECVKQINLKHHFVKECTEEIITIRDIDSDHNLAHGFTKALMKTKLK